jgi:hypothetical protein
VSGSDPVIGIDLGTTNSVAARCDDTGAPVVLADDKGGKIHPSVVSFHPNGSVVVGLEAKQRRDHRSAQHRLLGEAADRPAVPLARDPRGDAADALPDQGGRQPAAGDRHPRRRVRGAGDLGDRARPRAQRRRQGRWAATSAARW